MQQKKKICKNCQTEQFIFSKNRCLRCASIEDKKPDKNKTAPKAKNGTTLKAKKRTPIKKQTEKNKQKRSEERKDFPKFFQKHCQIIKDGDRRCENCGEAVLQGISAEVAHCLSKNQNAHPEIATNDSNVVYLCFWGNSCHTKFDSSLSNRLLMPVFSLAAERLKTIQHLITNQTKEYQLYLDYYEKR